MRIEHEFWQKNEMTSTNPLPPEKSLLIQDDFLDEADFEVFSREIQSQPFTEASEWLSAWNFQSPTVWRSPEMVYRGRYTEELQSDVIEVPDGSSLDLFFSKMISNPAYQKRFGNAFSARIYLHPPGSILDWHVDSGRYIGAFAYYAHPYWHASWGGELMVVNTRYGDFDLEAMGFTDKEELREACIADEIYKNKTSDLLLNQATDTSFVFPRPNRLVFVNRDYFHRVNPTVSFAATPRVSIAGFFFF